MKNNKLIILLLVFGIVFNQSCTDGFEEANTDSTRLTAVELNLLLPEILASSAFNAGANQNRIAGLVMQQFFGVDAQQEQYMRYVLPENALDGYWTTGLYAGVLRSCRVISDQATVAGAPMYKAIADIVMANQLGIATAFFGDIPYSEAFQGTDLLQPKYDTQESIYTAVQGLLDGAITTLEGLSGSGGYFGGDLIYGGDAASWIKAAKGFKARYLLHTIKRNGGNAAAAMTNAMASFSSNAENMNFAFGSAATDNYSLAKFGTERPSTLGITQEFSDMMEGDPRKDFYMDGLEYFVLGNANLTWAQNNAVVPLMSHTELAFIRAELTAMGGGDATAILEEAVRSSMELVGVTDAALIDAYVAANVSANPSVEAILSEAYKAYYGFNFHETWSNWRRTSFPSLTVRSDGSSDFMSSLVIPQRLLIGDSESTTNKANAEAAKAAQGGGLLDVPVWAFQ